MPKRAHFSSILAIVAIATLAAPGIASAQSERETIGAFEVALDRWERTGTPVMHMPNRTVHSRLLWTSADGKVEIVIEDDGNILNKLYTVTFEEDRRCLSNTRPLGPLTTPPSTDAFWRYEIDAFPEMMERCQSGWDADIIAAYQSEMRAALPSYPEAADAWKRNSLEAFPSQRRCTQIVHAMQFPGWDCAEWSDEVTQSDAATGATS